MRYGFYLPTRGPLINRPDLLRFVKTGEALGFHSVMVADHIAIPVKTESVYPYTADGKFLSKGDALETLTTMSFIAGATEKLRMVSSVMIVPHRNPVFTAKALATIDVLSGGRVTVGVGVGWFREEFDALHAADFDRRGAVTNEYLEIFKKLWTQSPVAHQGEFYRFEALRCEPLPIQKPHPPIWVGGHSRPALRRAARYGDGWHPVGAVAASPLPPEEMRQKLDELKRLTEAEGRDFSQDHDLLQGAALRAEPEGGRGRAPPLYRLGGAGGGRRPGIRRARHFGADLRLPWRHDRRQHGRHGPLRPRDHAAHARLSRRLRRGGRRSGQRAILSTNR